MKWHKIGKRDFAAHVPGGLIIQTEALGQNDNEWQAMLVFVPCADDAAVEFIANEEE